jgi:hypothetical protein
MRYFPISSWYGCYIIQSIKPAVTFSDNKSRAGGSPVRKDSFIEVKATDVAFLLDEYRWQYHEGLPKASF